MGWDLPDGDEIISENVLFIWFEISYKQSGRLPVPIRAITKNS